MKRFLLAFAALGAAACDKSADVTPVAKPPAFIAPTAVTKRADEPLPKLRYTDVTKESGVTFVHDTGADGRKFLPETVGSGCAIFDYDAPPRRRSSRRHCRPAPAARP